MGGCSQNTKNGLGFDFFRPVPQKWQRISQIVRVIDNETWASFANVENRE
jgi:hypothetical protein